jgi:hypothetical protein
MNLAQTKIYLEKIIALYKSMSADERNISPIERDLMLSYIRQLYETCLDNTPSVSAAAQTPAPVKPTPAPPKVEAPRAVEAPKVEVPVAPPPRFTPPPVVEAPQYVAPPPPPPPPVVEPPRYVAPAPESPRYVAPPPPPPPAPEPPPRHSRATHAPSSGVSAEDRIANVAIPDLTKAFGFNDRLLMQNELFLGNKTAFDETLKDLNNSSSFDTARAFLADLAVRNNWNLNGERQKHAKAFIKLVRRRFK